MKYVMRCVAGFTCNSLLYKLLELFKVLYLIDMASGPPSTNTREYRQLQTLRHIYAIAIPYSLLYTHDSIFTKIYK